MSSEQKNNFITSIVELSSKEQLSDGNQDQQQGAQPTEIQESIKCQNPGSYLDEFTSKNSIDRILKLKLKGIKTRFRTNVNIMTIDIQKRKLQLLSQSINMFLYVPIFNDLIRFKQQFYFIQIFNIFQSFLQNKMQLLFINLNINILQLKLHQFTLFLMLKIPLKVFFFVHQQFNCDYKIFNYLLQL
ncbi:hypothetical protein TTHERM_00037590 (macronuclear) [Tetrahymena thermophila SB210]|uniref:Uncharacterized protein n=1 Tax=Tetrahymena thermophila (strain SB210) TaxID=312017 RepID=Q22M61_TETTS|nr:hypothetical protein TTHERM_00037590 [Tetrahymena thermophila SB210]EAR86448.2 hypothetical protein TTHERM_00037590 [Tetrahymena thermophila SB210]|eukprot:XP_977159.2 hypothetical protein TTHERM_00037590 [Tetrahymena thermophila SB210]